MVYISLKHLFCCISCIFIYSIFIFILFKIPPWMFILSVNEGSILTSWSSWRFVHFSLYFCEPLFYAFWGPFIRCIKVYYYYVFLMNLSFYHSEATLFYLQQIWIIFGLYIFQKFFRTFLSFGDSKNMYIRLLELSHSSLMYCSSFSTFFSVFIEFTKLFLCCV